MPSADVTRAHKHCSKHRAELLASNLCGCFYCLAVFPPGAIEHWIDEADGTALCPHCTVDSVIGDASGFPVTAKFLGKMKAPWFGR